MFDNGKALLQCIGWVENQEVFDINPGSAENYKMVLGELL